MNKYNKELFMVVKNAIDKWNPYGLLSDEPDDEFDRESKAVATKIDFNSSINDIADVISKVFSSSFEHEHFQKNNCMDVAKEIKQLILNIQNLK